MTQQPVISIVLCTYNNADSLGITLNQITQQAVTDSASIELIVVDNNSTDNTAELVQQIQSQAAITLRYIFEAQQGLSHARNTGVEQALGDYILFTDDDAEVPSNWVSHYLAKITESQPDCLFSKINIIWDQPKPWWYSNRLAIYFAALDYGSQAFEVTNHAWQFIGKNFCLKKSVIIALGGFDTALGRKGTNLAAGEETLLYKKLITSNKKVIYFPGAPVGHRLKAREYTEENIKRQIIEGASSAYYIARLTAKKKVLGRPLGVLKINLNVLITSIVHIPLAWVKGNRPDVFYHVMEVKRSLTVLTLWFSPSK